MTTSATLDDLGHCLPFVSGLREANLLKHVHLDAVRKYLQSNIKAGPEALATHLVSQGVLTRYQADQALVGNGAKLTLWTYTLLDSIGNSSRGTLFKARNKTDNKVYCVKILPRRNAINLPKMARQLKPFQEFKNDSVIPIVHIGASGDRQYLVWPFISEGETIASLVERKGQLSVEETLRFAIQAGEGLAVCHDHEMFHGLLKPSNFVIAPNGTVRMLAFGIGFMLTMSKDESLIDTMNTQEQLASCIDCGAPESLLDPTNRTPAGDQYSLGCVLFFCLTGQYPFPDGTDVQKVMAHTAQEPASVRELAPKTPAWLENVIVRLMQKDVEDRYPSMREVVEALKQKKSKPAMAKESPGEKPAGSANGTKARPTSPSHQGTKPQPTTKSAQGVRPRPAASAATTPQAAPKPSGVVPETSDKGGRGGIHPAVWAGAILVMGLAGFAAWWFLT